MRPVLAAQSPPHTVLWLALIVALATALGLVHLGDTSLWMDETISTTYARLPWSEFLTVIARQDQNMALYNLLLRAWIHVGESEFAIRSLSLLWAVAAVPAIYALGAHLFDRRIGLLAALLLSVNGFHLRYAQEARAYSLLVFLVILSTLFFVTALERPDRTRWAAYVVSSVLAVYTHYFALLVLAAQWASLPFLRLRALPWKALVGSALAIGLLVLPLGALVLAGAPGMGWVPRSGLHAIYDLFLHLAGYAGKPALVAYAILCMMALAGPLRRRTALVVSWLVVPVVLAWLLSLVKPLFVPRFLIVSLPAFVILAAAGLGSIRRPAPLAAALGAFVLIALPGIRFQYRQPFQEDWRGVAGHVLSRARPGDALVFHLGSGRGPFDWYRRRSFADHAPPTTIFPTSGGEDELPTVLRSLPDGFGRVWLILAPAPSFPERGAAGRLVQASLSAIYPSVEETKFARITVRLYQRPQGR